MKYFEDICIGEVMELGVINVPAVEIKDFARKFDRLPFHLSEEAAKDTIFKGLIASGLHTLSLAASIIVDEFLRETSMTGASGMTDVRWMRPVRPGDDLHVRINPISKVAPSAGKTFGTINIELTVHDGSDCPYMTGVVSYLFSIKN